MQDERTDSGRQSPDDSHGRSDSNSSERADDSDSEEARVDSGQLHSEGSTPGRLPATELCDSCNEELAQFDEIVKAGGVHWRCLDCGLSGTIGKSDYADMLRDYMEIKPPVPCGVEFETCKEHLDAGIAHDGADNKEE